MGAAFNDDGVFGCQFAEKDDDDGNGNIDGNGNDSNGNNDVNGND